jgi:hypothetical protein
MAVGGEDKSNKFFRDRKINLLDVTMKYGSMVVFIRHDSALIIGPLKIMASTGVFELVFFSLNHPISGHRRQPSMFFT